MTYLVETTHTCVCRCHCHKGTICGLAYDPGKGDCEHDCRGTQSTVVCDPFIVREDSSPTWAEALGIDEGPAFYQTPEDPA